MPRKEGTALVSYSSRHLLAAVHFARASRRLEALDAKLKYEDDISFASGAIMSAVAFLEAAINQLFSEGLSAPLPWHSEENRRAFERLAELWPAVEREGILAKFQAALTIFDKPRFDTSAQPYQRADLLISLRNTIVHFHPEWVDLKNSAEGNTKLQKLGRSLQAEFPPNPLSGPHLPYFPHRCLGAGCASWAVTAARTFADDFAGQLNIKLEHNLMLQISPEKFDL